MIGIPAPGVQTAEQAILFVHRRGGQYSRLAQMTWLWTAMSTTSSTVNPDGDGRALPSPREVWAASCYQTLLFNLVNPEQKRAIYPEFGLDWQRVRGAIQEAFTDDHRRASMTQSTNIFRVLIKTLLKAGIMHCTSTSIRSHAPVATASS